MRSIAFSTIKGGVGKTTLSVHVAASLADRGLKVLLLDLDPQAHASMVLGLDPGDHPCVADAFGPRPRCSLADVVVTNPKRPSLFVAPACARMGGLERELFGWGYRLQAIPRALATLGWEPDVVIADTPPSVGAYTEAVLASFDLVVAPVPAGAFALQGLGEIQSAWRFAREQGGDLVVVVNMWDRRTNATNAAMEEAFKDLERPVLKMRIPRAEALNQAGLGFEVVFDTHPTSPVAHALDKLTAELARKAQLPKLGKRKLMVGLQPPRSQAGAMVGPA